MLKKLVIAQIIVLLIEIALGMFLLNQYSADTKIVHMVVGTLTGLSALATAFVAFREKASGSIMGLTMATLAFTILAYVGGKITATDYDLGLMIMRGGAVVALLLSLVCFYMLTKRKSI